MQNILDVIEVDNNGELTYDKFTKDMEVRNSVLGFKNELNEYFEQNFKEMMIDGMSLREKIKLCILHSHSQALYRRKIYLMGPIIGRLMEPTRENVIGMCILHSVMELFGITSVWANLSIIIIGLCAAFQN